MTEPLRCYGIRPFVDIVFDGPPSHDAPRFIEVESPPGKSISFGEWVQRDDGYWVLRFPAPVTENRPDPVREAERDIVFAALNWRGSWANPEMEERLLESLDKYEALLAARREKEKGNG